MQNIPPFNLPSDSLLTILSSYYGLQGGYRRVFVTAKCVCGTVKDYTKNNITTGTTRSCGCHRIKISNLKEANRTDLLTRKRPHLLHSVRKDMVRRCTNPNDPAYHRYGGRGIKVCDEWLHSAKLFIIWAESNGWKQGLQIDRENNDGDYSPDNCRIVTQLINANNTSTVRRITYNEKTQSIADWARELKMNPDLLYGRLKRWSIEKSFLTPAKVVKGGQAQ